MKKQYGIIHIFGYQDQYHNGKMASMVTFQGFCQDFIDKN